MKICAIRQDVEKTRQNLCKITTKVKYTYGGKSGRKLSGMSSERRIRK